MRKIITIIFLIVVIFAMYNRFKPLPEGVSGDWETHNVPGDSITFISDETYVNPQGERFVEQGIFDEVMNMIERADKYILVDMFLFNDFQGKTIEDTRFIADELTQKLIDKEDDVEITFITDPINTIYGGIESDNINRLREEGINVVVTDLTKLRDSNIIYSAFWRPILRYIPLDFIRLPNPFSVTGDGVGANAYTSLLNLKANHRKLIVTDDGDKMMTLITSANPHDGSSAHGNVAVKIEDYIWRDAIASEVAVGNFSDVAVSNYVGDVSDDKGTVKVRLITEAKIRDSILDSITYTKSGDLIYLSMFYLSEKKIIRTLRKALKRGVDIKVILDPNKDAFGREKNGIPNRVIANDLIKSGAELKWCDTHGEQCHAKMMLIKQRNNSTLIIGSSNYTRRNLKDFNLETNVIISGNRDVPVLSDSEEYFNRLWNNEEEKIYTVDSDVYLENSYIKRAMYNVMEITGLSSF